MIEQWQELKETIIELRDSNGTGTQQEVCKFLANYMDILEKQMVDAQSMRDATEEERKSVKDYIESISKPTGFNFYEAQPTNLTAEEKEIIDAIHKMGLFRTNYANDKVSKAVSKIIKAYEAQQTDVDCIRIQAVLGLIADYDLNMGQVVKGIHALPSVTPSFNSIKTELKPCEDCISREAVETFKEELIDKLAYTGYTEEYKNEIIDIINQMPSVYPERPKGKWIDDLITKVLAEVDGGTDDLYIRYNDICERIEASIKEFFSAEMSRGGEDEADN